MCIVHIYAINIPVIPTSMRYIVQGTKTPLRICRSRFFTPITASPANISVRAIMLPADAPTTPSDNNMLTLKPSACPTVLKKFPNMMFEIVAKKRLQSKMKKFSSRFSK